MAHLFCFPNVFQKDEPLSLRLAENFSTIRTFLLWWFDLDYMNYIVVGINLNDERYVLVLFAPQRIWVVYLVVLVVLIVLDALTIVADCAGHALAAVGTLALRSLARLAALTGTLILGLRLQRQR
jgi:hypothetical protein